MRAELGFVAGKPPRDAAFSPAMEAELAHLRAFLSLVPACHGAQAPWL